MNIYFSSVCHANSTLASTDRNKMKSTSNKQKQAGRIIYRQTYVRPLQRIKCFWCILNKCFARFNIYRWDEYKYDILNQHSVF